MPKILAALLTILFAFLFIPKNEIAAATADDVKFYVEYYYYGEQPKNLADMQTIDGIVDALDEYSRYMTPTEYKEYKAGSSLAADRKPITATTELVPAEPEATVTSALLHGAIGYMKINHFTANLHKEVGAHWAQLEKQGATELIVDLRYNGGGYVKTAEQFLGFFQEAPIAYAMSTRERDTVVKPIPATVKFPKQPYILVNRFSASASEMVAVSLQDQKAATIVGGQTKGKATIQSLYEFQDGSALKLTTGIFTGPNGTPVQDGGVTPDIKTEPDKELTTLHQQLLEQQLAQNGYTKIENTVHTTDGKTIHLQLPGKMNFLGAYASNKIQLIQLGYKTTPVTIDQTKDRKVLNITPTKARPDSEFIVLIQPTMERLNGKRINTKMYTIITPETSRE